MNDEKIKTIMEDLLTSNLDVEQMTEIKSALEKQIPKEPIYEGEMIGKYICPVCDYKKILYAEWHCKHCGQALKW